MGTILFPPNAPSSAAGPHPPAQPLARRHPLEPLLGAGPCPAAPGSGSHRPRAAPAGPDERSTPSQHPPAPAEGPARPGGPPARLQAPPSRAAALTQPRAPHRRARSCPREEKEMEKDGSDSRTHTARRKWGCAARPPGSFTRRAPRQRSAPRGPLGTGRAAGADGGCSSAPGRRTGGGAEGRSGPPRPRPIPAAGAWPEAFQSRA